MELQNAKGTKDYLPEEMIILNEIMAKLRTYFERAGYNPVTTPVIESMNILAAKYAGGSEILKETFQLQDQGGRKLGLRYDLTVPFARIVGQNPQLKFPFKRYQMEKVYRDGPISAGRYREFWQCDIDLVGSKSMMAEAELMNIVETFFKSYSLIPKISINNRKIMNSILDKFRIDNKIPVILILDKFLKLSEEELIKEMLELGYGMDESKNLISTFDQFANIKSNEEKIKICEELAITKEGKEGIAEIKEMLKYCNSYDLDCVFFEPILARGLTYYTGSVFEVTIPGNKIKSSVSAGGRFDNMIGEFLESEEKYPAVGLSFGVSRIYDALVADKKTFIKKTVTQVFVYSIGQEVEAIKIAKKLRDEGINTEVDLIGRKPGKNLKYAIGMEIPFVIVVGENEVKNKTVSLKTSDGWKELSVEEAIKLIKN